MNAAPEQSSAIRDLSFVQRHFSNHANDVARISAVSSLVICAEKPDISSVNRIIDDITAAAPDQVKADLKRLSDLRGQWVRSQFHAQLAPTIKQTSDQLGGITWTPPSDLQDALKAKRLLSNDTISQNDTWFDAFVKQIAAVRLCHVRHISKKGADLNGQRHFDAHLQPEDHPSYLGRVEAAMEVLGSGNIPLQARQLLQQAIKTSEHDFRHHLDISVLRPVKDYEDHSNSYNFLTAVYTKLLRDAIIDVAKVYYPTSDIRIHDEPVMMLTKTNRTDADSLGRIVKQPLFELGDVDGKNVIVADDHVNAGAFTTTLVSQAETKGARVVGVAAFSRHPNSGNLLLKDDVKKALLQLHHSEEINELLGRVGVSVDTLTNREGLTLLSILMDGANDNHVRTFQSVMDAVNGDYNFLLDGIGDDLESELLKIPKTPRDLIQEIDAMFQNGPVR